MRFTYQVVERASARGDPDNWKRPGKGIVCRMTSFLGCGLIGELGALFGGDSVVEVVLPYIYKYRMPVIQAAHDNNAGVKKTYHQV